MNYDLLSEFLLAGVTFYIAWGEYTSRPGISLCMASIGVAALLGALIFSGVASADGPHSFISMLASCAGLPLFAVSLRWHDGELVNRRTAAVRFFLIASGICLWMVEVMHLTLWSQLIPALSALLIMVTAIQSKQLMSILGGITLLVCFTLNVLAINVYPLDTDQQLHILLSVSFLLLVQKRQRDA